MNETWVEYTVRATDGNEVTYSVPLRGRLVIVPTSVAGRVVLQLVGPGGEQVECVEAEVVSIRLSSAEENARPKVSDSPRVNALLPQGPRTDFSVTYVYDACGDSSDPQSDD
jgi:hypothetical protein